MYTITVKQVVGDLVKEVAIGTDDLELVREILANQEIISVESDEPNRSISEEWSELQRLMYEQNPLYDPTASFPFAVTC